MKVAKMLDTKLFYGKGNSWRDVVPNVLILNKVIEDEDPPWRKKISIHYPRHSIGIFVYTYTGNALCDLISTRRFRPFKGLLLLPISI